MSITVRSSAFADGARIPDRHACKGPDLSPPLTFEGVPAEARSLALICDDPDAPTPQPWVHWVIYGLPADTRELPAGVPTDIRLEAPQGAMQGKNSWGTLGYRGPAPPPGHGTHHYHFQLLALSEAPKLPPGATKAELLEAVEGQVLARGELVGTYSR